MGRGGRAIVGLGIGALLGVAAGGPIGALAGGVIGTFVGAATKSGKPTGPSVPPRYAGGGPLGHPTGPGASETAWRFEEKLAFTSGFIAGAARRGVIDPETAGRLRQEIDARRRTPDRVDDFSGWLTWMGEEHREVIELLGAIDPYFSSLTDIRNMVSRLFIEYFG